MAKYSQSGGGKGKIIIIKKKKKKGKKGKRKTEKKTPSVSQKVSQNVNVSITQPVKRIYQRNRSIQPRTSSVNYQPPILIETQRTGQNAYNNFQNTYGIRLKAIEKGLNGLTGNMNNLTSQIQNGTNQPLIRPQPASVLNKPPPPIPDINKPIGLPEPLSAPFSSPQPPSGIRPSESVETQQGLFQNLKADAFFKQQETLSRQQTETESNLDRIEDLQRSISQASEEAKEELQEIKRKPRNIRYVFKRRQQYSLNVFNRVKSGEITEQEALNLPETKDYQQRQAEATKRLQESIKKANEKKRKEQELSETITSSIQEEGDDEGGGI